MVAALSSEVKAQRAAETAMRSKRAGAAAMEDDADRLLLYQLDERLTVADRALLKAAHQHPIDVERLPADTSLFSVVWLLHYKLLASWVDPGERVWIRATGAGSMLVAGLPKRRKRDRSKAALAARAAQESV